MQKKSLVVPEIHLINFPFFWFVSFFREVRTFNVDPRSESITGGRIKLLARDKFISADQASTERDQAFELWKKNEEKLGSDQWKIKHRKQTLDLTLRARQELALYFERTYMLSKIIERENGKYLIVDGLVHRFLRKKFSDDVSFWPAEHSRLSSINVLLDYVYHVALQWNRVFKLAKELLKGIFIRKEQISREIAVVWDAVNAMEMSLNPGRFTFKWFIDNQKIKKDKVLFLYTFPVSDKFLSEIRAAGFNFFTLQQIYSRLPVFSVASVLLRLIGIVGLRLLIPRFSWSSISKTKYALESLRYEPIILGLNPKIYVESNSQIGYEGAQLETLKAHGIYTLMYWYSANCFHYVGENNLELKFRNMFFGSPMADEVLVWHDEFKSFMEHHEPQQKKITVMGPLMPGNEFLMEKTARQNRIDHGYADSADKKVISIFDVAPMASHLFVKDVYPDYYTVDYVTDFMMDVLGLEDRIDNLLFIFKPKRTIGDKRYSYPKKLVDLLKTKEDEGKLIQLEKTTDPWLAIAMADLNIGIPFTSPLLAASHYGRPSLYYDPWDKTKSHRYGAIEGYISKNVEDLTVQTKRLLNVSKSEHLPEWKTFIGPKPGTNSTERFRTFLQGFIER